MYRGEYIMTGSGPAMMNPSAMMERPESETVETRFGKITVYPQQPIIFPNGMLGLADKMQFCLTDFPSEKMGRFKLLHCLEDNNLSFITLPVDLQNPIVERADLISAAGDLNIPLEHLTTLLVISVHREADGVKLSVNARAPILLHEVKRVATQHVFSNAKYQIRQSLTL